MAGLGDSPLTRVGVGWATRERRGANSDLGPGHRLIRMKHVLKTTQKSCFSGSGTQIWRVDVQGKGLGTTAG